MEWSGRVGPLFGALKRRCYLVVMVAVAVLLAGVYLWADPRREWMPHCPFKLLTGWDCPACGNQRALYALLHGDWAGAWRYNPFLWIAAPYFVLVLFTTYDPSPYAARWRRVVQHRMVVLLFLALTVLWWILRNML